MLCWRQNSFNRNGNVLPLSDHVQFEMHSLGGNLSCSAFLFPPFLSFWLLLIIRWDAERGLFRAWQKGNSMNLMSLFDLSGRAHILMHKHTHTLESTFISSNPFHGAAGARACPSMYWAEVREIPQTGCEHIRGLMEINRHALICGYLSFSNVSSVFYLLRIHVVCILGGNTRKSCQLHRTTQICITWKLYHKSKTIASWTFFNMHVLVSLSHIHEGICCLLLKG